MKDFWEGFNKKAGVASSVGKFFTRGMSTLPKELQKGLKIKATSGGVPDSLFLMPVTWGAKKIVGKHKVDKALWRKIHRPATSFDTAAGNVAKDTIGKIPGLKNLFVLKQRLPVKRKGERLLKEFERPSITAPLAKGQKIVAPFAIALGAEKMLEGLRNKGKPAPKVVTDTMQGV